MSSYDALHNDIQYRALCRAQDRGQDYLACLEYSAPFYKELASVPEKLFVCVVCKDGLFWMEKTSDIREMVETKGALPGNLRGWKVDYNGRPGQSKQQHDVFIERAKSHYTKCFFHTMADLEY